MTTAPLILESLVERAGQLYSLPRVAVEVLELTGQPQVDVRRLKQVIETDPALTARLLRVVNSSLYGLSREVGDLNQALALLGIKPLKLLVLGFSLPDAMFAGAPGDLLGRFWQHTLTRAVAAREISQRFCQVPGDEPFIAGLLRDLGQLVLARELGATYIDFWRHVAENGGSLAALERESLGFDHTQLTARLLEHWKMPASLVEAVAAPDASLDQAPTADRARELRRILHLAELSAWLLAARRLGTLPELLEAAQAWLGLGRQELAAFLAGLHAKVAQLADLMSLKIDADYADVVHAAQARLAEVAADAAEELVRHALETPAESLDAPAVRALSETVAHYARGQFSAGESGRTNPAVAANVAPAAVAAPSGGDVLQGDRRKLLPRRKADRPAQKPESHAAPLHDEWPGLEPLVAAAVAACRAAREPLSLLCLELTGHADLAFALGPARADEVLRAVSQACQRVEHDGLRWLQTAETRFVLVLPDCGRRQAVQVGDHLLADLRQTVAILSGNHSAMVSLSAGAATVSLPPKNFLAHELIDRADRCLYAARAAGGDCVKSIEIL